MKKEKHIKAMSGVMAVSMIGSVIGGMPPVMAAKPDKVNYPDMSPKSDTYVFNNDDSVKGGLDYAVLGSSMNTIPEGINYFNDGTENINMVYVSFNIQNIDVSKLDDAQLKLSIIEGAASNGATVQIFGTESDIDENTTTWSNKPDITDVTEEQGEAGVITSADAISQAEVSGSEITVSNLGKYIKAAKEAAKDTVTFAVYLNSAATVKVGTRENEDASKKPTLSFTVIDEEAIANAGTLIMAVPGLDLEKGIYVPSDIPESEYSQQTKDLIAARNAAIAAYNALTPAEKECLNEDEGIYTKLKEFYSDEQWAIKNKNYNEAVRIRALINDIDTATMTAENYTDYKAKIKTARTEYDKANFTTKALIGNKIYQVLVDAEKKYNAYEAEDINAVKEKIEMIGTVDETNYLNSGQYIVAARTAYDLFDQKMSDKFGDTSDEYKNLMKKLESDKETLEEAEKTVAELKKQTADELVKEWNQLKAAYGSGDITKSVGFDGEALFEQKQNLLKGFEENYYRKSGNSLADSVYYKDFASGAVSGDTVSGDAVKTVIEEYLCAEYQCAVDLIKTKYGDPDDKNGKFYTIFSNTEENMYEYMYTYRAEAEEAYTKLSDEMKAAYKSESDYCDKVYEAMMTYIGTIVDDVLDIELSPVTLTKAFIDELHDKYAKMENIPDEIINFLFLHPDEYQYMSDAYTAAVEKLNQACEELKQKAADELAKYGAVNDSLDAYGLNYMSGYVLDGENGVKNEADSYWNIDEFISDTQAEYDNINPNGVLEYYYEKFDEDNVDKDKQELKLTRDYTNAKITEFTDHNTVIRNLRAAADAANAKWDEIIAVLPETDIERITNRDNYATLESVNEEIDTILAGNSTSREAFDKLLEEAHQLILSGSDSYIQLSAAYREKYSSEGFTDVKLPYMSEKALELFNSLIKALYPDEEANAEAQEWIENVHKLYQYVSDLDKEAEYLNGFNEVTESLEVDGALKCYNTLLDEYNAFSADVKYYIDRETTVQFSSIADMLKIYWQAAIKVMNAIDEAERAELTDEWADKLLDAETQLNALQTNEPAAYALVAEAAKDKLKQVRYDYNLYQDFEQWALRVDKAGGPIREYAQLYTYDSTGNRVASKLSLDIDELENMADELFDDLDSRLSKASQTMKDYINTSEKYNQSAAAIKKLAQEKAIALEAEALDQRIISLDTLSGDAYATELESLRQEIDSMIETISKSSEEDKRANNAAIKFGMLTQYAKYEYHIQNYDQKLADAFIQAVENIGNITWTSDLDAVKTALEDCGQAEKRLNDAQKKLAYNAIIRLGILNKKYQRVDAARKASQDLIQDIQDQIGKINGTQLKADPYDYEYKKLRSDYDEIIASTDVVNKSIDAVKDSDVYQYLLHNNYISNFENTVAGFMDETAYIANILEIQVLESDMKEVIDFDENGNVIIDEAARTELTENVKAALENYLVLSQEQRNNVLNYSSLQWLVKNIDAARVNDIISSIEALPSADEITYAGYVGAVESIKNQYDSLLSENQGRIQLHNGGQTYNKLMDILVKMAMLEEEYGDLGGKSGDVNGDGTIDIRDILLMIDYAFDPSKELTGEAEKQFLRGNVVKETGTEKEKIDFKDVAAVIDLIEFGD